MQKPHLFIFLFSIIFLGSCQEPPSDVPDYVLFTGTVEKTAAGNKLYYSSGFEEGEAELIDGQFSVKIPTDRPLFIRSSIGGNLWHSFADTNEAWLWTLLSAR